MVKPTARKTEIGIFEFWNGSTDMHWDAIGLYGVETDIDSLVKKL